MKKHLQVKAVTQEQLRGTLQEYLNQKPRGIPTILHQEDQSE